MERPKEIVYTPLSEIFKGRRVSFDMDGVLSFSIYPVIEKVNEDFNTDFSVNDFFGWATVKTWAQENWHRRRAAVDSMAKSPDEYDLWIWTDPKILFNGIMGRGSDFVTRCAVENADHTRVITSRIPALRESTLKWYPNNLPWIANDMISINSNPDVAGEIFKYEEIARQKIDLHFEDSLRHAKLIVENTPAQVVLLANWDDSRYKGFSHPRIFQVSREAQRLITLRDVHKKLIFGGILDNVAQS
jgi:uncharacterized HAD superfamily protein